MLFATVGQGLRFIWMMAAGAMIGAWYLAMAVLRRCMGAGFWLTLICDMIFGAGSAILLIIALVAGNYGQVRPFEIVGCLLGVAIFACAIYAPIKYLDCKFQGIRKRIKAFFAKNRLIKVIFR